MDDRQIIALYHARSERAIRETDKRYGGFCHRIALNILSLQEDAEECVNDTYLTAWRRMPPDAPSCLKAFLGRIVRNLAISRYRANRAQKRYDGIELLLSELDECVPSAETVESAAQYRELTAVLNRWLDSLDEGSRLLFLRRYWYGDSIKDLAKAMGCKPNQLSQRLSRLRKGLKTRLESEGVIS